MSWLATAKAMQVREGVTSAEKMVMMSLADHHNRESGRCFPAVKTIADDAIISERQAVRVLQSLASKGFIEIQPQHTANGRQTSNEYTLTWCQGEGDTMTPSGGDTMSPEPGNNQEEERDNDNAPSARNLNSSGDKMAAWMSFLVDLDGGREMGVFSPIDNPEAYARTAARSGSSPPEDVDVALLIAVGRTVKLGMKLETVRLPGLDVIHETATWYGKCYRAVGDDFGQWLHWACGQVGRRGSLADDRLLLHALTQAGVLRPFSEWEESRASPPTENLSLPRRGGL